MYVLPSPGVAARLITSRDAQVTAYRRPGDGDGMADVDTRANQFFKAIVTALAAVRYL